jgi:hypothetical protein
MGGEEVYFHIFLKNKQGNTKIIQINEGEAITKEIKKKKCRSEKGNSE